MTGDVGVERPHQVTAADGIELQAWLASPPDPSGVLLLCHGLTTDAHENGAFPALRDRALRAGLAVARFDFRCHGRSEGAREQLRLAGMRLDVDALLGLIERELPTGLPLIPVGLSFGGAAAVHAAARGRCAGLVLWYAVVDYRHNYAVDSPVEFTRRSRAAANPATDPPWAEMPVLGTDWFFPKALIAEMAADETVARLRELSAPVLAYHGSRDWFVDVRPLRELAAERPSIDLRMAVGAGHGFFAWRSWVIRRTVAWAARAAAGYAVRPPSTIST